MVAEVTKPDFQYVWASGGAIVAPSTVKGQTGWTAEVPPFQWENYLQNRQDNAILHLFQKGISEWDAASNYYFTTSGTRSYVQGSDGNIYVAVQDSIGQNPTTDIADTYWKIAFVDASSLGTLTKGRLLNIRVFSTPGTFTYTPTTGTTSVVVEVQGAGGGGGSCSAPPAAGVAIAGGGGGGAYCASYLTSGFSGVTCTIGAGGIANDTAGGGTSSFGALLSAPGGKTNGQIQGTTFPFQVSSSLGGAIATGGNIINTSGSPGGQGLATSNGNSTSGAGGSSRFGTGGIGGIGTTVGVAGGFGAGGAGGVAQQATGGGTPAAGGAGGGGIIIIREYS